MTLRTRLVITACMLMLLALLFSGFATRSLLEGFLQERVDQQLRPVPGEIAKNPPRIVLQPETQGDAPADQSGEVDAPATDPDAPATDPAAAPAADLTQTPAPADGIADTNTGDETDTSGEDSEIDDNEDALPRETYIAYYDADGELLSWYNLDGRRYSEKAPGFLKKPRQGFVTRKGYRIFTQAVKIKAGADSKITHIAVARSLHEQKSILNRLALLQAAAGAGILVLLWLAGLLIIKRQFRPLEAIGVKAERIAAGDLSERIDGASASTEVGRLGLALNTMLSSIESAFRREERTNEQLRDFVADASHELKTPLTSLQGYAELHRYGALDDPEKVADAMQRIEMEAVRMSGLVEDLLLLARFDAQTPPLLLPVDLCAVAGKAAARTETAGENWKLDLRMPDEGCMILGEPESLERLIENLLSNACRYGGGSATLEISQNQTEVVMRVIDHGPGIAASDRARIFQRFVRLEKDRARTSGGTGLGLAIVQSITERHGGTIGVLETPSGGATFELRFPLGAR